MQHNRLVVVIDNLTGSAAITIDQTYAIYWNYLRISPNFLLKSDLLTRIIPPTNNSDFISFIDPPYLRLLGRQLVDDDSVTPGHIRSMH